MPIMSLGVGGKVQQIFADYFREHKEKNLSNWDCDIMGLEDKIIEAISGNMSTNIDSHARWPDEAKIWGHIANCDDCAWRFHAISKHAIQSKEQDTK